MSKQLPGLPQPSLSSQSRHRHMHTLLHTLKRAQVTAACTHFWGGWYPVYEQRRVDLATFRAVPASTWGHCPQVLCFTIVWDTPEKEKVAKWSSAPASILEGFNEILRRLRAPKPYKTRGKRQSCQIDPCLPPYGGTLWHEIITKIIPWEIFLVIFEAFGPLEMSRNEKHFQGITREIHNFPENNYFKIIFRK